MPTQWQYGVFCKYTRAVDKLKEEAINSLPELKL